MFCPFIRDECNRDCVFRCRPQAIPRETVHDTVTCLLAARIYAMNPAQQDQLSELIDSVRALD